MDTGNLVQLADTSKRLASRLLTIGENRLELLLLEIQEERDRILRVILLALGVVVFGLLAGVALTVAIVVVCWNHSPETAMIAMFGLAAAYAGCGAWLYASLMKLQKEWQSLSGTIEQLKKDRKCLEQYLA